MSNINRYFISLLIQRCENTNKSVSNITILIINYDEK